MTSLNPQQNKFVEEYLDTGNAKESAIRAGYSIHSAKSIGYQLLQKPEIKAELVDRKRERVLNLGITEQSVLEELWKIASANIQDFTEILEGNGSLSTLKRELAAGIIEYEKTATRTRIKFGDKLTALQLLGKHLGMFKDKVEHEVTLTLEQLVSKSFEQPVSPQIEDKSNIIEINESDSDREDSALERTS